MAQVKRTFQELPDDVALFLSGSETIEASEILAQEFGLNEEAADVLSNLAERVALGEVELDGLPQLFQSEFKLDELRAKQAAGKFASVQLLPIAGVIGDVEGAMRAWGVNGTVATGKPQAVVYGLKDAQAAAQEIASNYYLAEEQDRILRERLAHMLERYYGGEIDRAGLELLVGKPQKTGGLELAGEDLGELMARIDEQKKYVQVLRPPETKLPPPLTPPPPSPRLRGTGRAGGGLEAVPPLSKGGQRGGSEAKSIKPDTFSAADAHELQKMQAFVKDLSKSVKPEAVDAAGIAKTIADTAGLTLDPQLQERFAQVVDSRLRGVRDAYAARARLEDPKEKGGLGIVGSALAQVMILLEKAAQEAAGKSERKPILPRRPFAPIAPSAPHEPPVQQVRRAVAQVALSPASVITQKSARPKVEDIRFASRLAGPTEEIGNLGVVEFRRLNAEASRAAQKVQDKFELLASQGYDRKIAGVKAWRNSPLYRAYSSISQQALSGGKNVEEILAAAKGKDALTQEEFHAIARLNSVIKY